MLRHSRATDDCQFFTDRQMMNLFGRKRPGMVAVYSHLTMKDVEAYDLMLHGLKRREEVLRPLVQVVKCPTCGEENPPVAVYCAKCGEVLVNQDLDRLMADKGFMDQFVNHRIRRALRLGVACSLYVIGGFVLVMFFTFQWIALYLIWAGFVDWLVHSDLRIGFPVFLLGIPLALISAGFFLTRTLEFLEKMGKRMAFRT